MAQYDALTVAVTQGSATVTGAVGVDWSQISAGYRFYVIGDPRIYEITSVNTAARTLTILPSYQDATKAAAAYRIHTSFSANLQLPIIGDNDLATRELIRLMVDILDVQNYGGTSGGGGAPTDASYVVMGANSNLSQERRFQISGALSLADGGGNSTLTLSLVLASVAEAQAGIEATKVMTPATTLAAIQALAGGGGGGAPTNLPYVTIGLQGALSEERALAVTAPVVLTDGGPNANVTISVALASQPAVELPIPTDNATLMTPLRTFQMFEAQGGVGGGGGISIYVTPEAHGAIGDGLTNDAAAFNAAITDAVTSGNRLVGNPAKTYRITTSLAAFTDTLKIADCSFLAPNGVAILFGNPTWLAERIVTSLSTTTIQGTTVTRVMLTSTTSLAVGDWVMVGSTTVLWPGETNVRWFETAQIVALATNSSIDLHRRLIGEETALLNANLRLFKIPSYRLEADNLRFTADGDVLATGQTNRQAAIHLRGGIGHRINNCHAQSWWERFIRFSSAVKATVNNPSWGILPDIPGSNEAFGYGIEESAACYGNMVVNMQGGRCRHGYTCGGVDVATYNGAAPWDYGVITNSIVKGGTVSGASGSAFDAHAAAVGITFEGLTAQDPVNQPVGLTVPNGIQNRSYRTRIVNCTARGGDTGFRDTSAVTNWPAAMTPNIVEYSGIHASEYDTDGILIEGVAGNTSTTIMINGMEVSNGLHGIHIGGTNRYDGAIILRQFTAAELLGHCVLDDSGYAKIVVDGLLARFTGQVASALSPLRVNAVGAGAWTLDQIQILMRTTTSPIGLVQMGLVAALPLRIGHLVSDLGDLPLFNTSSVVGSSVVVTALRHTWAGQPYAEALVSSQAGNELPPGQPLIFWMGTQAAYDALSPNYFASTFYGIKV